MRCECFTGSRVKKKKLERTQSLYHVCVCVCVCLCVRVAFCRAACVAHGVDDPAFPDGVRARLLREFLRTWNLGNHCTETRWSKQEPE